TNSSATTPQNNQPARSRATAPFDVAGTTNGFDKRLNDPGRSRSDRLPISHPPVEREPQLRWLRKLPRVCRQRRCGPPFSIYRRRPVCRKKITVDFNGGTQSSNAGLLLLREKERTLGVCWRLASTMTDRRDPNRIRHEMFEMVMARVSAIACGYEDA